MSLSKPKLVNPCKKFIEFKGDSGIFQYWDKVAEKNVEVQKPFSFIVLDELSTITGFSDEYQCGIYSNEVHSLTDEPLSVRTFKGRTRIIGKYADIKKDITAIGGKFCKSVYAALINPDNTLELVNFQLKGIAFSAWMDCVIDKSAFAIKVEDCSNGKKGKVEYKIPNYKQASLSLDLLEKAVEIDKELQKYLKEYSQSQVIKDEAEQVKSEPIEEEVPF